MRTHTRTCTHMHFGTRTHNIYMKHARTHLHVCTRTQHLNDTYT